MITKVSVLKFLLLYTCLQKEELPISLTASVFPYWIIYNYIYIYTHTYVHMLLCFWSAWKNRTIDQQQKYLCWPYYIPFPLFLLSFSSSIPWKSYLVSKFSSSILFWTYSNQVFATFTSLKLLFSKSFVSPTLLNSVVFSQSSSCFTYQQYCHSL